MATGSQSTAPPFVRQLTLGSVGPDVTAVKRALIKWHNGARDGVTITPTMGAQAIKLLKAFQQAEKLHADGVYGPATHTKLAPFFDAYGIALLKREQQALEPRNLFLHVAELTVVHADLMAYSEIGGEAPGERDWFRVAPVNTDGSNWQAVVAAHGKLTSDCSGHYYGCAWHAGIRIPNPDGATGALLALNHIALSAAKPGDGVIFTGLQYPAGAHITILFKQIANDWETINNGGPTGTPPIYSTLSAQASWQAAHGAPTQVPVRLPA